MLSVRKSTAQILISCLLLTGSTASNILRLKEINNGNFILKEVNKKHATAPYKTVLVNDTINCMDKCTYDTGCKSVNVDENQSPIECQLVANDRNDADSYVVATGFKHYDTGKTHLTTFVSPSYAGCIIPRSMGCLKVDSGDDLVFVTDVAKHCSRLYAYFYFDSETGRLFHHCTGVPVCASSYSTTSSRLIIGYSCPDSNKEVSSSYTHAFRRTFQNYLNVGDYSLYLENGNGLSGPQLIKLTDWSKGGTSAHRSFDFPALANALPKKVRVRVYSASTTSLSTIIDAIAASPTNYIFTGYTDDFAHTTNSWDNAAYVHAANFVAPMTGWYHFAITCKPYCALFHGDTEATKKRIHDNDENSSGASFMNPSRSAQYAPGIFMEENKIYFLETVLLDATQTEFIGLSVQLPGIEDEWTPVSDKFLQKI